MKKLSLSHEEERKLLLALKELQARKVPEPELPDVQKKPIDFLDPTFPAQNHFIQDESRFKCALTARRAGKTNAAAIVLVKACIENPGVNCLFIGLTRPHVVNIFLDQALKDTLARLKIDVEINRSALTVKFSNGSTIYLFGADGKHNRKKLLGNKYKCVVIDEAGQYADLNELVEHEITPSLKDHLGSLILIGTPENYTKGLFYEATYEQLPQHKHWSIHKWKPTDNPYTRDQHNAELERKLKENPDFVKTAIYKQHWEGEWYIEDSALCYRFNPDKNIAKELPQNRQYYYIVGLDLGFNDPTAVVVLAYSFQEQTIYVVECYKKSGLDYISAGLVAKHIGQKYNAVRYVVDGANLQGVETMKQRCLMNFEIAEKHGKEDFVHIMNSDFQSGRIRIVEGKNTQLLIDEYQKLIRDEKAIGWKEKPGLPNHCADAALYAWRFASGYTHIPTQIAPEKSAQEIATERAERAYYYNLLDEEELEIRQSYSEDYL